MLEGVTIRGAKPYEVISLHPTGAYTTQPGKEEESLNIQVYGHELDAYTTLEVEVGAHPGRVPTLRGSKLVWVTKEELEMQCAPDVLQTMQSASRFMHPQVPGLPTTPKEISDKPSKAKAHINLGMEEQTDGNWNDALKAFQKALGLSKGPDAYLAICNLLKTWSESTDSQPDKLPQMRELAYLNLAITHLMRGDKERTETALFQSWQANGDSSGSQERYADFLRSEGKYEKAIKQYQELLRCGFEIEKNRKLNYKILGCSKTQWGSYDNLVEIASTDKARMFILLLAFAMSFDPKNPQVSEGYYMRALAKAGDHPLPEIVKYRTLQEKKAFEEGQQIELCRTISRKFRILKQHENALLYSPITVGLKHDSDDYLQRIRSMTELLSTHYTDSEIANEYHNWAQDYVNKKDLPSAIQVYIQGLQVHSLKDCAQLHMNLLILTFQTKDFTKMEMILNSLKWVSDQFAVEDERDPSLNQRMDELYNTILQGTYEDYFAIVNKNINSFQNIWGKKELVALYLKWASLAEHPSNKILILEQGIFAFPEVSLLHLQLIKTLIQNQDLGTNTLLINQLLWIAPDNDFEFVSGELPVIEETPPPEISDVAKDIYQQAQKPEANVYFIPLITQNFVAFKSIWGEEKLIDLYVLWADQFKTNKQDRKAIEIYMNGVADLENSVAIREGLFKLLCETKEVQYEPSAIETAKWLKKKKPDDAKAILANLYAFVLDAKLAWELANIFQQENNKKGAAEIIHRLAAKAYKETNYGKVTAYVARLDQIGLIECEFSDAEEKELAIWRSQAIDEVRFAELKNELMNLRDETLYALLWRKIVG